MWVQVTRVAVLLLWAEHVSGGIQKGEPAKCLAWGPGQFSSLHAKKVSCNLPQGYTDTDIELFLKQKGGKMWDFPDLLPFFSKLISFNFLLVGKSSPLYYATLGLLPNNVSTMIDEGAVV